MKKIWSNRFQLGHIETFLGKADEKWTIFFNELINNPKHIKVFETIVNCQECCRFFMMGKMDSGLDELNFAQIYEFDDFGGDRFVFSQFVDRDSEGKIIYVTYDMSKTIKFEFQLLSIFRIPMF